MVRTIVIPHDQTISFDIPEDYIGKQIEVIAFAKDESITKQKPSVKKVSFTVLYVTDQHYKFNREEADERRSFHIF